MMPCQVAASRRVLIISSATRFTSSIGSANPIPCAPARTATLMPISSPSMLTSGPPELPGLMQASVWIRLRYTWSSESVTLRFKALTMPTDTVFSYPKALPIVITLSPIIRSAELPIANRGQGTAGVDLDQRDVHHRVLLDHPARVLGAIGQVDLDPFDAVDHVLVGQNVAALVEDHAGPHAADAGPLVLLALKGQRAFDDDRFSLVMFATQGITFCTAARPECAVSWSTAQAKRYWPPPVRRPSAARRPAFRPARSPGTPRVEQRFETSRTVARWRPSRLTAISCQPEVAGVLSLRPGAAAPTPSHARRQSRPERQEVGRSPAGAVRPLGPYPRRQMALRTCIEIGSPSYRLEVCATRLAQVARSSLPLLNSRFSARSLEAALIDTERRWRVACSSTGVTESGVGEGAKWPKSHARRLKLEASLAEDPGDAFLRYGLAVQCLREGDVDEGRQRLKALIADEPDDSIAAYQQLGQSYLDTEDYDAGRPDSAARNQKGDRPKATTTRPPK